MTSLKQFSFPWTILRLVWLFCFSGILWMWTYWVNYLYETLSTDSMRGEYVSLIPNWPVISDWVQNEVGFYKGQPIELRINTIRARWSESRWESTLRTSIDWKYWAIWLTQYEPDDQVTRYVTKWTKELDRTYTQPYNQKAKRGILCMTTKMFTPNYNKKKVMNHCTEPFRINLSLDS